jgi:formamidopyrimidine-DNA glycosylase
MPELPEVETIKNQLTRLIVGKKISRVDILLPKIVRLDKNKFKKIVVGAKINKLSRRAKILTIELNNGWSMLIHLKMTGQLIYQSTTKNKQLAINNQATKNKHTHVIFYFSDGSGLLFNDLRQFGYLKLVQAEELEAFWEKEGLGPEALDKKFTFDRFKEILNKRPRVKIKQFLTDQKNIAGIGNIYADEILFFAGVHPLRQANSLSVRSAKDIFQGIKKILTLAIKLKGTSSSDYLDAHGQPGKFATQLKVYGRKGEKCVKCNGLIEKIKIVGRSASLCPICQPI